MWQLLNDLRNHSSSAYAQLRAKAKWEGMSLFAVLREWGDPRQGQKCVRVHQDDSCLRGEAGLRLEVKGSGPAKCRGVEAAPVRR